MPAVVPAHPNELPQPVCGEETVTDQLAFCLRHSLTFVSVRMVPNSPTELSRILLRGDLDSARDALSPVADWRALALALSAALDNARPSSVRSYVHVWQTVVRRLLDAAGLPDDARWETLLTDASADAPLSPWLAAHEPAEGLALTLLAQLRATVPGARPLFVPTADRALRVGSPLLPGPAPGVHDIARAQPHPPPVDTARAAIPFRVATLRILAQLDEPADLARVRSTFDLSTVELASLFGVSRQAMSHWLKDGKVPGVRSEKVSAVAALADVLDRNLRADRIPGVVRRPAAAYGEKTMLDLIRADRHLELLAATRASFDWSTAA